MPTPLTPYDAANLSSTEGRLWVIGLLAVPAGPSDIAAVAAVQAPCAPAALAYTGEPVELIAGSLVQLEGTYQLNHPGPPYGAVNLAAVALVLDNPATQLLGISPVPSPATLTLPSDGYLGSLRLIVAKPPE